MSVPDRCAQLDQADKQMLQLVIAHSRPVPAEKVFYQQAIGSSPSAGRNSTPRSVSMRVLRAVLFLALSMCGATAAAQDVSGPSFDCSAAAVAKNTVARLICADPRLSSIDRLFNESYQALRQQLDDAGQRALRQDDIDFQTLVYDQCQMVRDTTGTSPIATYAAPCVFEMHGRSATHGSTGSIPPARRKPLAHSRCMSRSSTIYSYSGFWPPRPESTATTAQKRVRQLSRGS